MKSYETIIVGAGISGLACARTLHDSGRDFLVLAKDLGGRMRTGPNNVNLGASYMTLDYKNVHRFVDRGQHLFTHDCYFFDGIFCTRLWNWRNWKYLGKILRLYLKVGQLRKHMNTLRKEALHQEQAILLKKDSLLTRYAGQSAKEFVEENGLQQLNEKYINPLFRSTLFCSYEQVNALTYLANLFPAIIPTFTCDFSNTIGRLTSGFGEKIRKCEVRRIRRSATGYVVQTNRGTFRSNNVVLAASHADLGKSCQIPKPHMVNSAYVLNVRGIRKKNHQHERVVFVEKDAEITILWRQKDGTDIIFSEVARPNLKEYYDVVRVLKRVYWKTATIIPGADWIKQDLGKGLYLASDYNISGLEDAFITGVFAANKIIERGN